MKKLTHTFFILFFALQTMANSVHPEFPDYEIIKKEVDANLKVGQTKVNFRINGIQLYEGNQLVWSADRMIDTVYLDETRTIIKVLKFGHYNLKFYHSAIYREIIIPRITLESGYSYLIDLNFKLEKRENVMLKKPVIYLYPTVPSIVDVRVKPRGKFTFTYPVYDDGWKVLANPDGTLFIDQQSYNYLFWESEQELMLEDYSFLTGFVVEGSNSIAFLEEKLSLMGLNSKEKADFITFWGPQLIKNKRNFIHFYTNEECNRFAELTITPQPKSIFRLYMVFSPFQSNADYNLNKQELPIYNRDGFTVFEWGGSEMTEIFLLNQVE